MGIILTSTGLPLLTSKGMAAAGAVAGAPIPVPKPIALNYERDGLISYRGVDFQFSTPLYWLASANGDPVVISHPDYLPSGSSITAMSPASTNASGFWANGAMRNPCANDSVEDSGGEAQGMDELCQSKGSGAGEYPYLHGMNVDPGANGPIAINRGDSFTIVKSVRRPDPNLADPEVRNIEKYVTLTVMGELPPAAGTWFRPSIPETTKGWAYRKEDLELSALRSLPRPHDVPSVSRALNDIFRQELRTIPMWWHSGEGGRRMVTSSEAAAGEGYSGAYGGQRAKWMLALHTDVAADGWTTSDKRDLAAILCQWGIDLIGAYRERGVDREQGAGQHFGYIQFGYLLAALFGDQAVLDDLYRIKSNDINQCGWVPASLPLRSFCWDPGSEGGSAGRPYEPHFTSEIGLPEWFEGGPASLAYADLKKSYREQWPRVAPYSILAMTLLQKGPGGQSGDEMVCGGPSLPKDTANPRAAALAYLDRLIVWEALPAGAPSSDARAIYAAWRDGIARPKWTGRPEMAVAGSFSCVNFAAGAGAGEIDVTFDTAHWSTEPITGREVEYSLDNVQFVGRQPVSARDTVTGLRANAEHFVRARQQSASGWSRRSQTWPEHIGSGASLPEFRGFFRTAGSSASPPVNTVAPAIHFRPHPGWDTTPPYAADKIATVPHVPQTTYGFESVTDVADMLDIRFYAGAGYWSGGGDLTFAYQWQRNDGTAGAWQNISGATRQHYDRSAADAGRSIRCEVSATDANGSGRAVTDAVAIPPAEQFPTGVLLSTAFDAGFPGTWPAAWANASGSSGDLLFLPYYYWAEGETLGGIALDKTSAHPTFSMPLGKVPAGGELFYEIHCPVGIHAGMAAQAGRSSEIRLKAGDATSAWKTIAIPHDSHQGQVYVARGAVKIPATASDTSVRLEVYGSSNYGGGGGGNPALSEAHLWLASAAANQFQPAMWSLSGKTVTLKEMPRANGAAISGVEYRVNGGGWTRAGVGGGSFAVAAAAGDRVSIRAVSANGAGPASLAKEIA